MLSTKLMLSTAMIGECGVIFNPFAKVPLFSVLLPASFFVIFYLLRVSGWDFSLCQIV